MTDHGPRCDAIRCWCAWPPTICVFSTGERGTYRELLPEGGARRSQYVPISTEEDHHP